MTEATIKLNRKELEKIVKLLDRFSNVSDFELVYKTTAIGSLLDIKFDYTLVDIDSIVTIPVTTVDNW